MNLTEMKAKPINELVDIAENLGIEDVGRLKKQEIIFRIFKQQAKEGVDIYGGGVLEILNDQKCNRLMAPFHGRQPSIGMGENASMENAPFL